jgi:hypothetical protein
MTNRSIEAVSNKRFAAWRLGLIGLILMVGCHAKQPVKVSVPPPPENFFCDPDHLDGNWEPMPCGIIYLECDDTDPIYHPEWWGRCTKVI